MDDGTSNSSTQSAVNNPAPTVHRQNSTGDHLTSILSPSGISSWAKSFRNPQPPEAAENDSKAGNAGMSAIARFSSGFGLRMPSMSPVRDDTAADTKAAAQSDVFKSITKGLVDTSQNAVKAMQVKARHIVSQNKRRYQEGEFDLDMTYITENIIGMGFPAGHMSSGLFGFIEGFYRNHMEEVIKFFETHHKGKYKVYNLCSERLYDASLFEGKVAHFPFDDHNCPPIHLIKSFCLSAYAWLKEDIENVVVVHCKAGMARTGLMICSLLLFLKFFHTSAEAIDYYNQKRCVDGKALVLPSQIRYVKYFERILIHFNGNTPPGRRCMLRGFRLHKCPYWVRPSITISNHSEILFSTKKHPKTKDLMPEDFWIRAPKKGFVVFALPGEPGLTELSGDFKIHFHDRHGDFYCWLNTTMTENKVLLSDTDLDGFDKRKLPTPGFQVEVVMIDYNGTLPTRSKTNSAGKGSDCRPIHDRVPGHEAAQSSKNKIPESEENDDVFSDSDEENGDTKTGLAQSTSETAKVDHSSTAISSDKIGSLARETNHLSLGNERNLQINAPKEPNIGGMIQPSGLETPNMDSASASEFKAIAADASVFTFGDEEDFDSE
ncbi:phosphatidylinositol 3,4,5-trisphosphate 3-phosphatase and protein-tyrosine-phosphatase PTEN2A-like [Cucurbita pepo subsp. pepo]|uniref:phosphatidylinositol 3,4,5-trisphosphate 3-phosphatase and protein-tyrosine-phosphatase PTEN2A-like n=1 Tax=Cucurbita pepo subsp. pepo TaxID=3664 RepID=UPI000C9D9209|nr:phosphatidylinositol 3,4,5-trisphosphate 3-phosphatase and protein-tyrosine-phosphatase PTEN2A-like [Cucurbita pepo subsp. pepo]